jgi:phosphatidylglycerophosphatase B
LLKISLFSYALLLGAVWLFYPQFTAISKDNVWSSVAYWATVSAGKTGTLVIVAATSLLYAINQPSAREKVKIFVQSFLVIGGLLTAFALVNEHLVKPVAKLSRPSHSYMVSHTNAGTNMDSVYALEQGEREAFFRELIDADSMSYKSIDKRILDHWVEESGYSFPSGHSFNAFLLAGILSFSAYRLSGKKTRLLSLIPLFWAALVGLSRVALGAHTPLDVSVGAGVGLLLSHTLLGFSITRNLLTPKGQSI